MPVYRGSMGAPATASSAPAGGTSLDLVAGAALAGWHAVVGVGYYDDANGDVTLTGAGGGWTRHILAHPDGNHDALFSKPLAAPFAGGPITATFANPVFYRGMCGLYLAGVDPASPVDVVGNGGIGSAGGWQAPLTTTIDGTIIVAFGHNPFMSSGASIPSAGFNLVADFINAPEAAGYAMVYGFGPTAGVYVPQALASFGGHGVSAAFKAPPDPPGDEDVLVRRAGRWVPSDEKTYLGGLWL